MGWMKDKAFFFVNLQLLRAYDTALVTRTVYTQAAQSKVCFVTSWAEQMRRLVPPPPQLTEAAQPVLPACNGTPPTNSPCIASYNIANNPTGMVMDPTLSALINAMPLPNNFTTGDGLNTAGFNFPSPQREKQYDFVSKFDFNLRRQQLALCALCAGKSEHFRRFGEWRASDLSGFTKLCRHGAHSEEPRRQLALVADADT